MQPVNLQGTNIHGCNHVVTMAFLHWLNWRIMYLGFPSIQLVGQRNAEQSTFDNISQDFEAQAPGLQCLSLLWDLAWEVRTMAYKSATPFDQFCQIR